MSEIETPLKSKAEFHDEIRALKDENLFEQADAVAELAEATFPDDASWAAERAWIAFDQGDFVKSIEIWRGLRAKAERPQIAHFIGEGVACHRAGRYQEADAIYIEALELFPPNRQIFVDFAWNSDAQGARAETIRRWQQVKEHFPDVPEAYRRMGTCLVDEGRWEEAEAILQEGMTKLPDRAELFIDHAWYAEWKGDLPEALKRWETVKTLFPHCPEGYWATGKTLMDLGRLEDAEVLLAPSLRMFPDDRHVLEINGWLASRQRSVQKADEIWAEFRSRFPDEMAGYLGWAAVLRAEGRLLEAETLLIEAEKREPSNVWVALELANVQTDRYDWDKALARWRKIVADAPHMSEAYEGLVKTLMAMGNIEEAKRVFVAGESLANRDVHAEIASLALAGNLLDANMVKNRAQSLVERYPDRPDVYVAVGDLFRKSGALDEAENLLTEALEGFPGHVELEVQLAQAISAKREWARVMPLWAKLGERNPSNGTIRTAIANCLWQARQDQAFLFVEGQSQAAAFDIPASLFEMVGDDHEKELQELFMKFECIGTTCEFGLVQRRFGAEPIGLLRWSSTTPENLATALVHKLDGVGEPEHTIIEVINGEYITRDDRYYMMSHTFTLATSEPLEEFSVAQCQRLQFLKRKLLGDLKAAKKIFVYVADSKDTVTDDEAILLHDALRGYADSIKLLCVRLEEPDWPAGEVREIRPGLSIGFLNRLSTIDISFDHWIALCRKMTAVTADTAM